LLEDEDLTVRRAAIAAAGKLGNTKLLPPIVSLLPDVALREASATALAEFGEKALPQLQKALRDPDQDGATMKRLMRIVAHIGGSDAETILCDQLGHPVWAVQSAAYQALSLCGYRAQKGVGKRIQDCIRREAERAAWCWAAFRDLAALESSDVLRKALRGDIHRCEDNLIALLSCLYPSAPVMAARRGLRSESSDARAQALEILDSIVEAEIKAFLSALLDDLPLANRLDVLNRHFPQSASDATVRLVQMFDASTPVGLWTRLCSLYVVGQARLRDLKDELTPHLDDRLEMVRETARWSHSRL
jgi:HEAT repeat protein